MTKKDTCTERTTLGHSKNSIPVWYDKVSSHAATHIKDTPGLKRLVIKITHNSELKDDYIQFHTDLGHIVGYSDLVDIEPGDEIVYAKRINRNEYTIFNLSKPPHPSSYVTTAYEKKSDGTYELVSAWIGPSDSPSFPGTELETSDSREFWAKHALAWGAQEIQPTTKTDICPW